MNQECDGKKVLASDTNECCIGDCVLIDSEPECEKQLYICKPSCSEDEEEKTGLSDSCNLGSVCCGKKAVEKGNSYLLLILLVILIILVILAIIFRNQLKIWLFRFKSGYRSKKLGKPPYPPRAPQPAIFRPPILSTLRPPQRPIQKPNSKPVDKDFEETMRKLKEMSK